MAPVYTCFEIIIINCAPPQKLITIYLEILATMA